MREASCKLTPAVQKAIVTALEGGNTHRTAAHLAGIGPSTMRDWMRRGRDGEAPFDAFVAAVKKAVSTGEGELVAIIRSAAADPKYWTAAAWLLERRNPKVWGRRDRAATPPPPHEAAQNRETQVALAKFVLEAHGEKAA